MELKQIKELMAAMGRSGIKKLLVKEEDFELQLEREELGRVMQANFPELEGTHLSASQLPSVEMPIISHQAMMPHPHQGESTSAKKEEASSRFVTSPMVGTFYAAPAPDAPFFVKVGDRIDENTVVCIIEAMKVMNEVKARASGVVAEILLESGHPVEFGTKILRIV